MKPTPMLEELKIAAEAASHCANAPDIADLIELLDEDVVPGVNDAIKRHKKLCNVLREALAWCKQDATNEDCFPSQDMLDARVDALQEALKLARE
jgi:hypothetical protein